MCSREIEDRGANITMPRNVPKCYCNVAKSCFLNLRLYNKLYEENGAEIDNDVVTDTERIVEIPISLFIFYSH